MFQLLELIENEEDREFCRKLSEQFDSAMYHVAYGILKNSADAEDAVQETYGQVTTEPNSGDWDTTYITVREIRFPANAPL